MTYPFLASILLAAAQPAALARPADTPRAFVERLYAGYRNDDFSPFTRPERYFAPPLAAALAEDARLFTGEIGFVDADPFCQCQDTGGMRAAIRAVRQPTRTSAQAQVALGFGAEVEPRTLTLILVRTPAGWRVADIASPGEPSYLRALQASNRAERARRARR